MEGILKKLNPSYEVIAKAADGGEGLELIRTLKPDVILLDIRMPDMDGLTMLGELRKEGIVCQAMILTAYSDFSYAKQALELGVQSYLLKPVRIGELKRAMETAERKLRGDEKRDVLLNRENMVRGAMTGILTRSEETVSALKTTYQIEERDPLGLFVVWLGSDFEKNTVSAENQVDVFKLVTTLSKPSACPDTSSRIRAVMSLFFSKSEPSHTTKRPRGSLSSI